jgi:invasion protein IalB
MDIRPCAAAQTGFGDHSMTHSGILSALRNLSFAALMAVPMAASAQDAGAPPESRWIKVCGEDEATKAQICNISFVLVAQTGSLIASFSLQPLPEKTVAVGAFVPLGYIIPAGVQFAIDGETKATAQYTICVPPSSEGPGGCAVRADLGEDFVDAMKKGNKLHIVLANTAGKAIPIEMTLLGFSKTYDSEGLDPVAARALEVEQSRQLQDDAKAAFQRMIERQQAESGTAN